jgi:hypothetical protein
MPIAISYPALTCCIDDTRMTPTASRPCWVAYGGVTSRPVVIATDDALARALNAEMTAAMTRKGLADTCINPALWLDDADIIAAARAAGCQVIGI